MQEALCNFLGVGSLCHGGLCTEFFCSFGVLWVGGKLAGAWREGDGGGGEGDLGERRSKVRCFAETKYSHCWIINIFVECLKYIQIHTCGAYIKANLKYPHKWI